MRYIIRQCTICIFAIIISLSFVSCKSEEATKVDDLILKIGTVTLDSEQAIETAEIYYQALTEKQKEQIENTVVLLQSRRDFDKLWEEEQSRLKLEEEARIKAEEDARIKAEAEAEAKITEQALGLTKEIIDNINIVYPLINDYVDNLLRIWGYHMENAYELSIDINGKSIDMLASFLDISEDEVRDAMSLAMWRTTVASVENYFKSPEELTDDENELRELFQADAIVSAYYPSMTKFGLIGATASKMLIESIYIKNGSFETIDRQLEITEKLINEMKNMSPDYTHYEKITECYNALERYYEFIQDFQGDYSTISGKIIEHQDTVSGYINYLEHEISEY